VRAATRKSELRRAEDPIDAVLCAYIARYAATRPQDVTVYGETATGCIVTPTLRP
jgi:predicted RNase H-like nuclease